LWIKLFAFFMKQTKQLDTGRGGGNETWKELRTIDLLNGYFNEEKESWKIKWLRLFEHKTIHFGVQYNRKPE